MEAGGWQEHVHTGASGHAVVLASYDEGHTCATEHQIPKLGYPTNSGKESLKVSSTCELPEC